MSARSEELIAASEATVDIESLFDTVVMENSQSNRRLANPASTDESGGCEVLSEVNDLFDQLVTPETNPR